MRLDIGDTASLALRDRATEETERAIERTAPDRRHVGPGPRPPDAVPPDPPNPAAGTARRRPRGVAAVYFTVIGAAFITR